eukprot:9083049-Lingulodinium_polyedra.AAC.1
MADPRGCAALGWSGSAGVRRGGGTPGRAAELEGPGALPAGSAARGGGGRAPAAGHAPHTIAGGPGGEALARFSARGRS